MSLPGSGVPAGNDLVVDTSAMVAILRGEPGVDRLARQLDPTRVEGTPKPFR